MGTRGARCLAAGVLVTVLAVAIGGCAPLSFNPASPMKFAAENAPKPLKLKNTEAIGGNEWSIVETTLVGSLIFKEKDPNRCEFKKFKPTEECAVEWEVKPLELKKVAVWFVKTTLGTETYAFET
jgi:hypothetical protein